MKIKAYITHKFAENFADCQDRFGVNEDTKSIAVSDGMGSTWQQKIWAQILVDTFIENRDWCPNKNTIVPLCAIWRQEVVAFIQNMKDTNVPEHRIYRNERSLIEGRSAGATFVGIRFHEDKWTGTVLGDSCLIEWKGSEAIFHTSQDVEAFDSYPDYFDSDASKEGKGTPKDINGVLPVGEFLFLVSDPFSEFLLEHSKQGDIGHYVQQLLALSSHDDFESLVDEWRKEGMHNDDTTLVIVENDGSNNFFTIEPDDINALIEKEKEIQETNGVKSEEAKEETETGIKSEENVPTEKAGQEDEEYQSPSNEQNVPLKLVDSDVFIEEFLTVYKKELENKHCRLMSQLKYKWTQEAAKKALRKLQEKYTIICK